MTKVEKIREDLEIEPFLLRIIQKKMLPLYKISHSESPSENEIIIGSEEDLLLTIHYQK